MNLFVICILILAMGFLLWKGWFWLSWEIEKRLFFWSVRHFLEKGGEEKASAVKKGK